MRKNILLIIVDCLRYDYAEDPQKMPFLAGWGTHFHKHFSTSHCTDPAITHMLFGKHPDELKLYSMMYGDKSYKIGSGYQPVMRLAMDNDYWTAIITNLGRWYHRGVHMPYNSRGWPGKRIFRQAYAIITRCPGTWLVVVHTDDMHTKYTGGSYDAAAAAVDEYIESLVKTCVDDNTLCIITADHGEGLGQKGPDGVSIEQHGYGLWDFLTHVPFITNAELVRADPQWTTDPGIIYKLMCDTVSGVEGLHFEPNRQVFQAGATPKMFHRGYYYNGAHFIRATSGERHTDYYYITYDDVERDDVTWGVHEAALADYCRTHGIDYGDYGTEAAVIERLKGLGYWPE